MEFQAVDVHGPIHIERVDTKPKWEPSDEGRFIYVRDERISYYGSDEMWVRATGNGLRPVLVEENYTAEAQDLCLVDTRNGPIVITLPPTPKEGAEIMVIDIAGSFESNQCTLQRNGNLIQRLEKNLVLDINDFSGSLIFSKTVGSWKVSIEGVAQVVGNATLFVHKHLAIAKNIDNQGGQKQFVLPFKYNNNKDNLAVFIDGVKQYYYERTNLNSITFDETVPEGCVVEVVSIPIEGGFNIDRFANIDDLNNCLKFSEFTGQTILSKLLDVDGPGSGLDADLLDGKHGNAFVLTTEYTPQKILEHLKTVDGSGSGLDADLLDGRHALPVVDKDYKVRANKIPVANSDGVLDAEWIPFKVGASEVLESIDIEGNPTVLDITGLEYKSNYLILLANITPFTDNVRFLSRVYDSKIADWISYPFWSVQYANHISGGLRDFNTDSDMIMCENASNARNGLTGWIYLSGFGNYNASESPIKTVRSDIVSLGALNTFANLHQGAGVFNKSTNALTGLRLYFSSGTIVTGKVSVIKLNLG